MSIVNLEKNMLKTDNSPLIQSLTESGLLEKWQEYFCGMTKSFACCVDSKGEPITEFGGNPDETQRVLKAIDKEQFQDMLSIILRRVEIV